MFIFLIGWNAVRPNGDIILWWCSLRTTQQFPKNIKVVWETSIMCRTSIRHNFFLKIAVVHFIRITMYKVHCEKRRVDFTSKYSWFFFVVRKISLGFNFDIKLFTKCCLRSLSAVLCCGLDINCVGYWHHSI